MPTPRILIIGAGVNGSACAIGLQNAGMDLTVLARGKRYEEVSAEGIVIEDPFSHRRRSARVRVIQALAPEDTFDFVLVVVRKNQVADLLPVLAQNRSPNVVFMGNNLSDPEEIIRALGQERVMLGAVYAAGKRDGKVIRAMVSKSVAAPFGEVDGSITPRLRLLIQILGGAGFKAKASSHIVDFQMTHAAGVALIGPLTLKHHCDASALARSTADLELFVDGRREAHRVLRALGHRIVPRSEELLTSIPRFLQVAGFGLLLRSRLGEVGLAYHVSQAPDEMHQLAMELQTLVDRAGLPVPAIRKILVYA